MQLFYLADLSGQTFEFTEEESKHCIRVLRKQKGDHITLIDGKGTEAKAILENDHPKKCGGTILQKVLHEPKRNYHLHLAIAPTKNFDRMEWMIEKAIEIGVDEISFIETANSERAKINIERCEKIAISAIKQSKQFYLPKINPITTFANCIKQIDQKASKYIAWCETAQTESLAQQIPNPLPKSAVLLIGPEGDFNEKEIDLAVQHGFKPCSLGNTILRSETAAILGVSTFSIQAQLNNN